ncbi:MAG: hypothetical protein NTW49_04915 [Bacteroidia bacterium]|nr:hypothetical protein [Bacteroidia bacterium]
MISENIRKLLKFNKLTAGELCNEIGISQNTFYICMRKNSFKETILQKIAGVLKVAVTDITGEAELLLPEVKPVKATKEVKAKGKKGRPRIVKEEKVKAAKAKVDKTKIEKAKVEKAKAEKAKAEKVKVERVKKVKAEKVVAAKPVAEILPAKVRVRKARVAKAEKVVVSDASGKEFTMMKMELEYLKQLMRVKDELIELLKRK